MANGWQTPPLLYWRHGKAHTMNLQVNPLIERTQAEPEAGFLAGPGPAQPVAALFTVPYKRKLSRKYAGMHSATLRKPGIYTDFTVG